jgi:hypothetical protein
MMRWLVAGAALVGCGRIAFEPVAEPPVTAPWEGSFTVTPPELVAGINSAQLESECSVTPDGRTLYFASARQGGHDIYSAERAGPGAPFGPVVFHAELSTAVDEGRLVTMDGEHAYLWSDRAGGVGGTDLWELTQPFTNASGVDLAGVNSAGNEYDPWPAADGLRLYFSAGDIFVAERAAPGAPFGPPRVIAELSTADDEDNPTISADERFIIFSSDRPGGPGQKDIYFARRPDRDAAFSPPALLPVVNTPAMEWEACITEGGELFFSSDRTGGLGGNDIYRSVIQPAP